MKPIGTKSGAQRTANAAALARALSAHIEQGRWPPGFKLPAERVLGRDYGLSRGSVRKVLDDFNARGLLQRTQGSGTYVCASSAQGRARSATVSADISPAELMEGRLLFEPLMAGLIVRHATAQDFARLEHCLAQAEGAASFTDFEVWDSAFHRALSDATHNAFVSAVLDLMTQVREAGAWGRLKRQALTAVRRRRYQEQHRAIVAALRERDAQAAARHIKAHLSDVRTNLFDG